MFVITVADTDGKRVSIRPGGQAERDLVNEVKQRLKDKGVGFLRTEATVLAAVDEAITETLYALKSDVMP